MNSGLGLAPIKSEGTHWNLDEGRPATDEEIAATYAAATAQAEYRKTFRGRCAAFFQRVANAWAELQSLDDY